LPLDDDPVSIDANVVADFAVVGRIDILCTLFSGRLLLSDFVIAELARAAIVIDFAEEVNLAGDDLESFQSLRDQHRSLGLGEVGAICVARLRGAMVVTNDKDARRLATTLRLDVSGTLGILQHAVRKGTLTGPEAIQILSDMLEKGSWFGANLVQEFKRTLE
jgi:predicted nucleic acid-binding protein